MRANEFVIERKNYKRKSRGAAYGPGPYGGYGYYAGYSGDSGEGGDGGGGESIKNEDASGIDFDMQFDDDTGSFATVTARAQGRTLGSVKFFMDGDTLEADMVEVDERYRGQGIAAAMYDYAKSQGYTIEKSSNLTPDGDHFWNKNRGEEPVWEQGMAENFADGRNPQDKGDSKRHGVPTKSSVSTLRKVAKQGGRKGQLAHWMANMKSGRSKKK
jgi:GNAT superfamily N-acetyltransferase